MAVALAAMLDPDYALLPFFLGGEVMGRCFTLVTLGILGGCHAFAEIGIDYLVCKNVHSAADIL